MATENRPLKTDQAAELLHISASTFRRLVKKLNIEPDGTYVNRRSHSECPLWAPATVRKLAKNPEVRAIQARAAKRRAASAAALEAWRREEGNRPVNRVLQGRAKSRQRGGGSSRSRASSFRGGGGPRPRTLPVPRSAQALAGPRGRGYAGPQERSHASCPPSSGAARTLPASCYPASTTTCENERA
jgi:hypothetical protein